MLNIINVVNDISGWKVIGWTKKGEINDIAFNETDASTKLTSAEINHHITTLVPAENMSTKDDFLNAQWKISMLQEYTLNYSIISLPYPNKNYTLLTFIKRFKIYNNKL